MQKVINTHYIQTALFILRSAEKKAIGLLLGLVVALVALYLYFLASAVVFAVEHKEVQFMTAQTNSQIATLEVAYLQKKSEVTEIMAESLGLTAVAHKTFVERARYLGQANAQ